MSNEQIPGFVPSTLVSRADQIIDHTLAEAALLRATNSAMDTVGRLLERNAPTVPPLKLPYRFEGEYGAELTKLVRAFAEDVRLECQTIETAKLTPEWSQLRALYLHYCNGLEDALYAHTAVLAAAIRAGKRAWVGDIVMDAWIEYADKALMQRVNEKVQELNEDDAAVRQSESVGR